MCYFLSCLFAAFLISGILGRSVEDIGSECGRVKSSYVCNPDDVLTNDEGKLC